MAASSKPPGRPRDPRVDQAVLDATVELLADAGLDATSVAAVAQRSGVARATIYLRWPSRAALITAAVRHSLRRDALRTTGDIAQDTRRGVELAWSNMFEPDFIRILPAVVRATTSSDDVPGVTFDTLFPARVRLAEQYRQLAAEQGFRTDVEPTIVFDLIVGAMLSIILATAKAPSAEFARQLTDVVLAGLRASD
jgi:AcrR family transcriptional regulator